MYLSNCSNVMTLFWETVKGLRDLPGRVDHWRQALKVIAWPHFWPWSFCFRVHRDERSPYNTLPGTPSSPRWTVSKINPPFLWLLLMHILSQSEYE